MATTRTEGSEKFLILRPKYQTDEVYPPPRSPSLSSQADVNRSVAGLPPAPSPAFSFSDNSPVTSPVPRQPPPYRPPPPVTMNTSSDNISISSSNFSVNSGDLESPTAPPRKKFSEKKLEAELNAVEGDDDGKDVEKQSVSVKERMQKFNKMASAEELNLSPRQLEKKKQPERVCLFLHIFPKSELHETCLLYEII